MDDKEMWELVEKVVNSNLPLFSTALIKLREDDKAVVRMCETMMDQKYKVMGLTADNEHLEDLGKQQERAMKKKSDEKSRKFWERVERAQKEIASWPDWKRDTFLKASGARQALSKSESGGLGGLGEEW